MKNGTRTLLVDFLLRKLTGENCYLSRSDFIERVNALGGDVTSPNTIKADLDAIKEFNELLDTRYEDILGEKSYGVSGKIEFKSVKKKGNHVVKETFESGELIILSKFIENCFYLDVVEKEELLHKVLVNTSLDTIKKYNLANGFDEATHYNPNQSSLATVNVIQRAIKDDCCLSFHYFNYGVSNNSFSRVDNGKDYFVYPIRFIMEGNYLYVIGYDLSGGNVTMLEAETLRLKNYRVDRIFCLQCVHRPKYLNDLLSREMVSAAKSLVSNNINGFGGDNYITLKLKIFIADGIDKSPFKAFVDRFGHKINDVQEFPDYLIITIKQVLDGIGLVHYLFGFDQQIVVLEPVALREKMQGILKQMSSNYL